MYRLYGDDFVFMFTDKRIVSVDLHVLTSGNLNLLIMQKRHKFTARIQAMHEFGGDGGARDTLG